MTTATQGPPTPTIGDLVAVRGQRWVVGDVSAGAPTDGRAPSHLVSLQSVEDGRYGQALDVIWEVERGRRVLPSGALPEVTERGFDPPERLAAFLDAVRWSAVTSAEVSTLQAPFRSGVAVESYQLEPVARAVNAPRVNLLLADDVGLGKTIEAGLVAQELILRHRAKRIMIICPAGLTIKWRDEMAERFGLDFTIIDTERCNIVRRTYGLGANPFTVHPLSIVSLPWLRGQKAQRLLDEVLPAEPTLPRAFDLLILDEAHHVAPAAARQVYTVDSQQTKLVRRIAPHFTHRLFLSATPHNGHETSFQALLEILDNQRFVRGVTPSRTAVRDIVVRRLKRDIVEADGTPRFPEREITALTVEYPESEREIHSLLKEFTALRRKRLVNERGHRATDLVTLLLKKRLFSSPAALAHTIEVYLETLRAGGAPAPVPARGDDVPDWLLDFIDDTATLDDDQLADAEDDAYARVRSMQPDATAEELALLDRMHRWAVAHEARADAKATELIKYLRQVCIPDGRDWTNERVVVFTEYRDTQRWLAELLRQEGLAGDRVAQLHGGVSAEEREQLRLAFQADPKQHPVRILLATDAAGEGIDLQRYCHRLVNYDIPFNPNKLEQRIGRIDRYGQRNRPEIRHFVGTGWGHAVDAREADLQFLAVVAHKVAQQERDLGSVNAVLAEQVQRRMRGELVSTRAIDEALDAAPKPDLPTETDVRAQVRRLRDRIDETVASLGITPAAVKRVVDVALHLARQQPLRRHVDDKHAVDGLWTVPTLTGSWQRAAAGLTDKLHRGSEPPRQLPVAFDPEVARGREEDVVLAHLNHPLVSMSTRVLRAAVSNDSLSLHRVAAVVHDAPEMEEDILVAAFARFVVVGADGVRLHEEVLQAGGWLPANGRFRRLDTKGTLTKLLDDALRAGRPASAAVQARLAQRWPGAIDNLHLALDARIKDRREQLGRVLEQRQQSEEKRLVANIEQFKQTLRAALAVDQAEEELALISLAEAKRMTMSRFELEQYRRDREAWQRRESTLDEEKDRELAAIAHRYSNQQDHWFPVAVVFVVSSREATR